MLILEEFIKDVLVSKSKQLSTVIKKVHFSDLTNLSELTPSRKTKSYFSICKSA